MGIYFLRKTALLVVAVLCGIGLIELASRLSTLEYNDTGGIQPKTNAAESLNASTCGVYREYPWPKNHSGLPYLADVFSSHDAQWVYFIVLNRGMCKEEYQKSDRFNAKGGLAHRFLCAFSPGNEMVLTDFIHASPGHENAFVARCRIPQELQHYVSSPQDETVLHVDLHALEDLEAEPIGPERIKPFPSINVRDTPKLERLPVCHPVDNNMTRVKAYNLTAVTRIKTKFFDPNTRERMSLPYKILLKEWIEYHQQMGVDHFIIHDSDKKPHGPLEKLLRPMVDSGLVTYRWFPLKDCFRKYGPWKGIPDARGQVAASMSALHRYGHTTRYIADFDVDEFFVPIQQANIMDLVQTVDDSYDAIAFKPYMMGPCNGVYVHGNETIMDKWRCFDHYYADKKLIFRPERIWSFFVHYPLTTPQGEQPKVYEMIGKTEGLLAHYRRIDSDPWRSDAFVGKVRNDLTYRMHFMDRFVESQGRINQK